MKYILLGIILAFGYAQALSMFYYPGSVNYRIKYEDYNSFIILSNVSGEINSYIYPYNTLRIVCKTCDGLYCVLDSDSYVSHAFNTGYGGREYINCIDTNTTELCHIYYTPSNISDDTFLYIFNGRERVSAIHLQWTIIDKEKPLEKDDFGNTDTNGVAVDVDIDSGRNSVGIDQIVSEPSISITGIIHIVLDSFIFISGITIFILYVVCSK